MTTIEEAWKQLTLWLDGLSREQRQAVYLQARIVALAVLDEATRRNHADGCFGCQWMGDEPDTPKRGEECGHAALRARIEQLGGGAEGS